MSRADLLFRAKRDGQLLNRVTAEDAGWSMLNMESRALEAGQRWEAAFEGCEAVIVLLSGTAVVDGHRLEGRPTVFDGLPHSVYVGLGQSASVVAETPCEIATSWVPAQTAYPNQVIQPRDCGVEIRGGGHATRQINSIVPPGFACDRIVCVEVFTPGGNWSSYPPHKHDEHVERDGAVVEAELEEFYYYKFRPSPDGRRDGYAVQRVYTSDRELDFTGTATEDDIIVVPRGYHPVSAAHGYDCYYLNFLAGSAQSLANSDDPDYAWLKDNWPPRDPRVPLVSLHTDT